jgi:large subunit ribosomal protein L4
MADAPSAKTTKDQPSGMTIAVLSPAPPRGGTKKIALDADVFGAEFKGPLVHEVVVAELAARRRGTHATRNRALARGGGAKPWRQKGTSRARAGSVRAPQFAGGATVFGPSPRKYTVKVNRKARRAALRCALSLHAGRGSLFALDAGGFSEPSTKQAADLIEDRRNGTVLVVADEALVHKSFRNLAGVTVVAGDDCGVADLVGAASVVFTADALEAITARARKKDRTTVAAGERGAAGDDERSEEAE